MPKKTKFRHEYAIGDIQGCSGSFKKLLKHIDFDAKKDKLWLAGDLVARGDNSLGTLRLVKSLCEQGAAETVLGNHDINLIAVWRGFSKAKTKDKTRQILNAKDCDELLEWLRTQPLLVRPNDNTVLTHAGLPHIWSVKKATELANEVQAVLSHSLKTLDAFLPKLYGSQPNLWSDKLTGAERLRCIANYLTRMRVADQDGRLEFDFKGGLHGDMPKGYQPWFMWDTERKQKALFGHWAALEASIDIPKARALDGGCVWGGSLLAYRLDDGKVFKVCG